MVSIRKVWFVWQMEKRMSGGYKNFTFDIVFTPPIKFRVDHLLWALGGVVWITAQLFIKSHIKCWCTSVIGDGCLHQPFKRLLQQKKKCTSKKSLDGKEKSNLHIAWKKSPIVRWSFFIFTVSHHQDILWGPKKSHPVALWMWQAVEWLHSTGPYWRLSKN